MPFFLVLAALVAIHGAFGQTPSTNRTFFQRFVAGEIPVREIVWRPQGLPRSTNAPPPRRLEWRSGWVTDSTFSERWEPDESGAADQLELKEAMGTSRSQYWSVRPDIVHTVDRNKSTPGFLGMPSTALALGQFGVHIAMVIQSLGLPPMDPRSVRWHPDGRFDAVGMNFLGDRFEPFPVSGRIVRQGDAGPLEIEFRSGTNAQPGRVEFFYGTRLGVALPERIVKLRGSDPELPDVEILIDRVNLEVSGLPPDGFTPWMFTRPGWNTNVMTWTNSTSHYGHGSPGQKHFVPWVERFYWQSRQILSGFP